MSLTTFPLRDLIIFRQLSKASSRDYDHLNRFVLPKKLNMQHGPLLKATSGVTLRGASVIGIVHFHAFCLLFSQAIYRLIFAYKTLSLS